MAAIRAELPEEPLPPAAAAAPPCDVAFAPERIEVLTKCSYRRANEPVQYEGNNVLSSQKEDDPLPIRARVIADNPFRNLGSLRKHCTSLPLWMGMYKFSRFSRLFICERDSGP